jgi:hypothetical protein
VAEKQTGRAHSILVWAFGGLIRKISGIVESGENGLFWLLGFESLQDLSTAQAGPAPCSLPLSSLGLWPGLSQGAWLVAQ